MSPMVLVAEIYPVKGHIIYPFPLSFLHPHVRTSHVRFGLRSLPSAIRAQYLGVETIHSWS